MKLRDLFVSIGFDVDDRNLKKLDDGLRKTKTLITALGAAGAAAAGTLFGMAKSVADVGDQTAKTADKLGVSIEALQEMRHAAELSGVAQTKFDVGLQRLTRRAAEAAQGTGVAKDAFEELGVSLLDQNGRVRQSDMLMADLAQAFAGIQDQSRKVALAFKLFDTEGVSMVNLLNQGREGFEAMRKEARDLGMVLSEKTARDSEKFQDELLRAKSVVLGIKNAIGGDLLPVITGLLKKFRVWVALNRRIIKSGINKFMAVLIAFLKTTYTVVKRLISLLRELTGYFGGLETVVRSAAWALSIFAGAYVLTSLGQMATAVMGIVKAFSALRLAALATNLQVMAVPLLIGAAVAALVFVIQDVISFFQGKDSVTGWVIRAFEEKFPRAFEVAKSYLIALKGAFSGVLTFLKGLSEYIVGLLTLDMAAMNRATVKMFDGIKRYGLALMGFIRSTVIDPLKPLLEMLSTRIEALADHVVSVFTAARDRVMALIGPLLEKIEAVKAFASNAKTRAQDMADSAGQTLSDAWSGVKGFFGDSVNAIQSTVMGPGAAPVSTSSRNIYNQQQFKVEAPITVTVPEGTAPADVGARVAAGVTNGLQRILRETARATEPILEY